MASATLNIKVTPRRMLMPREAAEYCGVSAKRFPTICSVRPIAYPDGQQLYDMQDLDRWIEGLKGGSAESEDAILSRLSE